MIAPRTPSSPISSADANLLAGIRYRRAFPPVPGSMLPIDGPDGPCDRIDTPGTHRPVSGRAGEGAHRHLSRQSYGIPHPNRRGRASGFKAHRRASPGGWNIGKPRDRTCGSAESRMKDAVLTRHELACRLAREAGALALGFFGDRSRLTIETKNSPQECGQPRRSWRSKS